MILICSDINEPSTDIVCSWLSHLNKKFLRISSRDEISIDKVCFIDGEMDIEFCINENKYKISQFHSYWYRRSKFKFKPFHKIEFSKDGVDISHEINNFLKKEYLKLIDLFNIKIHEIAKLNTYEDNYINKLNTLYQAQKIGIDIPITIVSESFDNQLFESNKWITKPISDMTIKKDGSSYYSTTKRVSIDDISNIGISKIQSEIDKEYEIRSFYFNNMFYSSVIFSQENPKTELDFRNYDFTNPNRVVPYRLPLELENKLIELCEKLGLKSGSFDIAYTKSKKYVLFEVNPVGQFEQVSFPCNYQIHKKIAEYL